MNIRFSLISQFAFLSFIIILLIAIVSGVMISGFLAEKLLYREATLTQDFVDSIIHADNELHFTPSLDISPEFEEFLQHITQLKDVSHAHIYSTERAIKWSTNPDLIGKDFHDNNGHELDSAINGKMAYEGGVVGARDPIDYEMMGIKEGLHFVGVYIPLWNKTHTKVIWVLEIYKQPYILHEAILEGQKLVWIIALLGAALLYVSLFWIIFRANRIMEKQSKKLIESRSLSMIGETASAVAHSMRNPLASIRASAELTLSDDLEGAIESAHDIINETDRLDRWARDLLEFSQAGSVQTYLINVHDLLNHVIEEHNNMINNAGILLSTEISRKKLMIKAETAPLEQAIGNLIVNAIEAMPSGGQLSISAEELKTKHSIQIKVSDTGIGLSKKMSKQLFRPFVTNKSNGTGLGLPLSRRLVERYHGTLKVVSTQNKGFTAIITLPVGKN